MFGASGVGYRVFSKSGEQLGPSHRNMIKSENHQRMRGALGVSWTSGQRPAGSGSSVPGEELELHPDGDGDFEQGHLCDEICVLWQPF